MNLLDIKNYSMSLIITNEEYNVLEDVSLSIPQKSIVALVGESGCGKSMTAMSILKLLPKKAVINSGEIYFKDKNILELSNKDLQNIRGNKISLIPQDPMTSLNPLYTIGNQIMEVINKNKSITKKDAIKKAIEVLDAVKIPNPKEKLTMYPHEFSGGMKQRAIIAMALASSADLIIADEPTTALDVTIQAQIMNILNEIKEEYGTSILLISHELNLVGQYSDIINVMYSGKIIEHATSKDFFKNTLHPYSVALLDSLPANKNADEKLLYIDGQPPTLQEKINGCKFNPRCRCLAGEKCCTIQPQLKEIHNQHFVACHKY